MGDLHDIVGAANRQAVEVARQVWLRVGKRLGVGRIQVHQLGHVKDLNAMVVGFL